MANHHPHAKLIEAVSSATVRAHFNLSHGRLSMWRKRGIPYAFRPAFAQLATINGKPVPSDFLAPPSA